MDGAAAVDTSADAAAMDAVTKVPATRRREESRLKRPGWLGRDLEFCSATNLRTRVIGIFETSRVKARTVLSEPEPGQRDRELE